MVRHLAAAALLLLSGLLAGCNGGGDAASADTVPRGSFAGATCTGPASFPTGREAEVVMRTNFGDLVLELYHEAVPVTVDNFLGLVRSGYYNGTTFHRILSGFMMQGGQNPSAARAPAIPDELHHGLRHDRKGILSMANAGPNTGSTQFFILFAPAPHLDDRHTVFGRVKEGLDVLDRIERDAATAQDGQPPRAEVQLVSATVRREGQQGNPGVIAAWTPDDHNGVPSYGGPTGFLTVVENCSPVPQRIGVTLEAEHGQWEVEPRFASFDIPGGQRATVVIEAVLEEEGPATAAANVRFQGSTSFAEVPLQATRSTRVGPQAAAVGDQVVADYIGILPDGRVFDTSRAEVGQDPRVPKFTGFFRSQPSDYDTFTFEPGAGVIPGFTQLADGTPYGGTAAGRIPAAQAYGERPCPRTPYEMLCGKTLLFQLDVHRRG
ncbi:MAG TPA: peptidylprolyl isomerase [Candidatus Thermoplasmatota archaeon]|nr:peptidylprolyl isomerase [Candidatus Thermoplasmatota archaeon]